MSESAHSQAERSAASEKKQPSTAQTKPATAKGLAKFPFDLNNLLGIQFDNLRAAIEYLAQQ